MADKVTSATAAYVTAIEKRRAKPKRSTIGGRYTGVSERALQHSNIDFGSTAVEQRKTAVTKTGVAAGAVAVAVPVHKYVGKTLVYPVTKWTGRKVLGIGKKAPAIGEAETVEGREVPKKEPTPIKKATRSGRKSQGQRQRKVSKRQRRERRIALAKKAQGVTEPHIPVAKPTPIKGEVWRPSTGPLAQGAPARGGATDRHAQPRTAAAIEAEIAALRSQVEANTNTVAENTPAKKKAAERRSVSEVGTPDAKAVPEIKLASGGTEPAAGTRRGPVPKIEGADPALVRRVLTKLDAGGGVAEVAQQVNLPKEKVQEILTKGAGDPAKIPTAGEPRPIADAGKADTKPASKRQPVKPAPTGPAKTSGVPSIPFAGEPDAKAAVENGGEKKAQKRPSVTKDVEKQIALERQVERAVRAGLRGSRIATVRGLGRRALVDLLATPDEVARIEAISKELKIHPKRVKAHILAEFGHQEKAGASQVKKKAEYIPAEGAEGSGGKKGAYNKRRRALDDAIFDASPERDKPVGKKSTVVPGPPSGPSPAPGRGTMTGIGALQDAQTKAELERPAVKNKPPKRSDPELRVRSDVANVAQVGKEGVARAKSLGEAMKAYRTARAALDAKAPVIPKPDIQIDIEGAEQRRVQKEGKAAVRKATTLGGAVRAHREAQQKLSVLGKKPRRSVPSAAPPDPAPKSIGQTSQPEVEIKGTKKGIPEPKAEPIPDSRKVLAADPEPAPRIDKPRAPEPRAAKINVERGVELPIDSKEAGAVRRAKTAATKHARAQLSGAKLGAEIAKGKGRDVQAALEESYQGAGRKAADAARSEAAMAEFLAKGGEVKPWVTKEAVLEEPKANTAKHTRRRLDEIVADQKVGPAEDVAAHKAEVKEARTKYIEDKKVAKRWMKSGRVSLDEYRGDLNKARAARDAAIGAADAKLEGIKAGSVERAVERAGTTRGKLEINRVVDPRSIEVQIGRDAAGTITARAVDAGMVGADPEAMQATPPEKDPASQKRQERRQAKKQARIGAALRREGATIETVQVRGTPGSPTAQPRPGTVAYGATTKKMSGENRPRGEMVSQSPSQRTTPEVLAHAEAEGQRRSVMREGQTSRAVHQAANLSEAMEAYRTGRPPSSRPSLAQKAAAAPAQPAMSVEPPSIPDAGAKPAPANKQAQIEAELAEAKAELAAREATGGRPGIKFAKDVAKGAVKGAAIGTALFSIPRVAEAAITTEGGLEERAGAVAPIVGETAKGVGTFVGAATGVKVGAAGVRKYMPQTAARIAGSGAGRMLAGAGARRLAGLALGLPGLAVMMAPDVVQSTQGVMKHFGYRGPTVRFGGPLGLVPTGIDRGPAAGAPAVHTVRDPNSGARRPRRSLRLR
jgi:hypothetical protein